MECHARGAGRSEGDGFGPRAQIQGAPAAAMMGDSGRFRLEGDSGSTGGGNDGEKAGNVTRT